MQPAQYLFIRDYHAIVRNARWTSPEGVALLDIFPILLADVPISADAPFARWLWTSKAIDSIYAAAREDSARYKHTIDTCEVVLALFR
tara:strand:- start:11344 stop:11607 length:264 start_codon:yes stop_codon:yes gene_type:complete